jgi:hypothetical protein
MPCTVFAVGMVRPVITFLRSVLFFANCDKSQMVFLCIGYRCMDFLRYCSITYLTSCILDIDVLFGNNI